MNTEYRNPREGDSSCDDPTPSRLLADGNHSLNILNASLIILSTTWFVSCGRSESSDERIEAAAVTDTTAAFALDEHLPEGIRDLLAPWSGDFDAMVERRIIRFLTVFTPQFYFLDGATQRGITYEMATAFERHINRRLGRRKLIVNVVIIPVMRDQLIPFIAEGRGDIAAAALTITPERLKHVDFSDPFTNQVSEVVVTGPAGPELTTLHDLAGQQVFLRRSSSYWESVAHLSELLEADGRAPIRLEPVEEYLEDDDLLEMVNAGLLPATVVDSYMADFWSQVLDSLHVHRELAVRVGSEIAWAVRKDSPQLLEAINGFVRSHKVGTRFGNVVVRKYLDDFRWVENALEQNDRQRFEELADLFQKYGELYGFDWLLLAAQGYQESRLDQGARSPAGAVGVMQVLPSTARHVGIPNVYDVEDNIHAGTRYLRSVVDDYFADPGLDATQRMFFAFASYNAGPTRISRLRRQAAAAGFDPDVWFDNVEVLASRAIGREPVRYVSNIAKYYVAYRLIAERAQLRRSEPLPK